MLASCKPVFQVSPVGPQWVSVACHFVVETADSEATRRCVTSFRSSATRFCVCSYKCVFLINSPVEFSSSTPLKQLLWLMTAWDVVFCGSIPSRYVPALYKIFDEILVPAAGVFLGALVQICNQSGWQHPMHGVGGI